MKTYNEKMSIYHGMASAVAQNTSNSYIPIFAMTILSGIFVSGTVLILFNPLLENSPQEVRTYCITTYNVLLAIIAFTAPQIGIWLLETYAMDIAMYASTAMRFLAAVSFLVLYIMRSNRQIA